jgi:hypothetical protein
MVRSKLNKNYTSKTFAIRKVKNGKIKIGNIYYKPQEHHMKYDGRLEGQRFAFGRYLHKEDIVSLWGTLEYFFDENASSDGPHVVDGTYPWLFWEKV